MQPLLDSIAKLRILVIGDLMLDHYIWGDASRLSPEAPVPIVKVGHDTHTAGGAANVASNLRALGAQAEVVGTFGADAYGRMLQTTLTERGVVCGGDCASGPAPTIVKTRVMCRNQQLCRIDREAPPSAYALPEAAVDALRGKLAAADAVILSDYAKGVVTSELIRRVQAEARPGQLIALDPKPRPGLSFTRVTLLTPNRAEALQLAELSGAEGPPFPAAEVVARIHARHAPEHLVVTLGGDGMLLSTDGLPGRQLPTAAREVFDVSGAGDTVIATLTAALAAGADIGRAAALANLAAGVVVGKLGTAT
ncbi:MAG: PfkB family carbohydrate kinase, partial [Verrucomicrobiota bacterium]|nr:PfkB family carbohydrate kinase [Verrucomicrobiota bacterium]